ncbi:MAG: hypothetical protein ACJ8FS_04990, partial [Sphingomicrobium sp.]
MKSAFAALFVLSLAACSTAAIERRPGIRPVQSEPNAIAAISMADILGQWDVVSFEGYKPARMHGATRAAVADFDEQSVRLRIECNTSSIGGTVRDGRYVS